MPPRAAAPASPVPPPRGPRPARLPLTLSLALPGHCLADAGTPAPPVIADPLTGLGQMLFSLAVVLAILVACVWLLKRFSAPMRGGGLLRVIAAAALGPRERAVLLEAGDKLILLGVTPNNVRTLHVFARDELPAVAAATTPPAAAPTAAAFAARLRQALQGRRNAG